MRAQTRCLVAALVLCGITIVHHGSMAAQGATAGVQMPKYDTAADVAKLRLIGRWKINTAKSAATTGGRPRSDNFTYVFSAEGDKLRHSIWDAYSAQPPDRTYVVKLNATEATDTRGLGAGQKITWWPIDQFMLLREVATNGVTTGHEFFQVSADGKVLIETMWSPRDPNPQGISRMMYLDRQEDAPTSK